LKRSLFAELKRRNVFRAAVLYIGTVWALAQGAAQLLPVFDVANWVVRWFIVAAATGFPFWIAFAWFYELTPEGLKLERDVEPSESITHHTARKLDLAIIGVLAVAVVLLLTDRFVLHRGANDDTAAIPDKSIAVLPLANDSGDKDQQYFSDGLSENLITALSQFHGLKVIGRSSAFQFRESKEDTKAIGVKLGVATLLEGSVRRAGDVVRINAELIKAIDGSTLWSQRYDRAYKDLFALQDEITQAVATALKAQLLADHKVAVQSDRPPSGNLDAYNTYLQAGFYYARATEADYHKAIELFTQATRLDPSYAQAWSGLSRAATNLGTAFLDVEAARQAYAEARVAADRALALAPDLALSHIARGYLLMNADFDWNGAEAEFRRAEELAPDSGDAKFELGRLQAILGRLGRAIELTRQASATDPLNARWHNWLAGYFSGLDRLDEAEAAARKSIELQPGAAVFHEQLTIILIQRGDAAGALVAARQEPPGAWQDAAIALALQIGPDRKAADSALQNLIDKHSTQDAYQVAQVYALRNDADETFAWLDRAWSTRDSGIRYLLYDPLILRFRSDPRFVRFCRSVNLPTPEDVAAEAGEKPKA
jgi:TolB-like protein/Flp pilus assembly protein TadD